MALKLLVLEDEIGLLESLKDFFQMVGYTVFTSQRGDEALAIVEKENPQIILCDLQLEGSPITGIEVLKQTSQKHPDIKVMVMTGYGEDESIVSVCKQYNPFMFLSKPVSVIKLHETLLEIAKTMK